MSRRKTITPTTPFLVDILTTIGLHWRKQGMPSGAEQTLFRVSHRLGALTGIPPTDFLLAALRLADGQSLDGYAPGSVEGDYFGPRPDLKHVAVALHELDRDGSGARVWEEFRDRVLALGDCPDAPAPVLVLTAEVGPDPCQGDEPPDQDTNTSPTRRSADERSHQETLALACLLRIGPNVARIAKELGIPRTTLLGWPEFKVRCNQMRADQALAKQRRRRGRRAGDGDFEVTDN